MKTRPTSCKYRIAVANRRRHTLTALGKLLKIILHKVLLLLKRCSQPADHLSTGLEVLATYMMASSLAKLSSCSSRRRRRNDGRASCTSLRGTSDSRPNPYTLQLSTTTQ